MNDFNTKLKAARAKQRLLLISASIGLAIIAVGVLGAMVMTNGTSVKIHPDEAASTGMIHVMEGFGFSIGDAVYAIGNEPIIQVSAVGYRPEERKVTFQEKGGSINVTLRPLPGRLIATTSPEDNATHWSVDGQAITISPSLDEELDAGEYAIEANNPYYVPEARTVTIARGEETNVSFALKPVEGHLHIEVLPQDAQIRIDGTPVGVAPIELNQQGGTYQVEVTHPDYITVTDSVEITNAEPNASRTYRLQRKTATLNFDPQPSGGNLLLDGSKIDPGMSATVTSKVEHKITYLKPGYFPQTQSVTLLPDQTQMIAFNLKPEIGKVAIKAEPNATVLVNGKKAGQTPISLSLPAIPQKISLRKPGYRSVNKTVTPNSKSPVLVQATLMTELAARLANEPKEYTNSAGIALKLFQPGQFVMGAPRHEKGQRANEFLKTVRIDKPFYAALHEVTKSQYAKFQGSRPEIGTENVPVTSINWEDAAKYCNWLSVKEGLTPFYILNGDKLVSINKTSDGYRLLTEAEWEWLARSAGRSKETVFPWGDDAVIPPMAGNIADESARGLSDFFVPNYNDGYVEIAPVGSFQKEASGLYDIVGNVSEWVHDYYSLIPPIPNTVEVDPLGAEYGDTHVIKGSNWRSGTRTELRAAYREGLMAGRDDLGFRVGRYLYGGVGNAQTQ